MARYFFNIIDGIFVADAVGEEFETLASAHRAAAIRGAEAMAQRDEQFWNGEGLRIVCTDATGEALFELSLTGRTYPRP